MATIYHVTNKPAWEKAVEAGRYECASLAEEGFIHCCEETQLAGVLERYYQGQTNLVKLVIETGKLTSPFYYEWSPSTADTFPHIYGPVNLEAVVAVTDL